MFIKCQFMTIQPIVLQSLSSINVNLMMVLYDKSWNHNNENTTSGNHEYLVSTNSFADYHEIFYWIFPFSSLKNGTRFIVRDSADSSVGLIP